MKYSFPAFENGFIRAAAASPALRVADCTYNADQIIGVMREYAEKNVQLLCLPEFALTGYTCSDLFLQDTLLRGAEDGLAAILKASEGLNVVVLVGLPVRHNGKQAGRQRDADRQIAGSLVQFQATDDVDVDVLIVKGVSGALFQHGQKQVHAVVVKAARRAPRAGKACFRRQRLNFAQHRACAFHDAGYAGAADADGPPLQHDL